MKLHPGVDVYIKTRNHRKTLHKTSEKRKKNLLKTKRILKDKLNVGPVFTFSFPGRRFAQSLTPLLGAFYKQ